MNEASEPATAAQSTVSSSTSAASRRRNRQLAILGGIGVAALAAYRVQATEISDPLLLALGVAMMVLGSLPAILWARRGDNQLPAFEVMMLVGIPFYVFPLFDQKPAVALFDDDVMFRAALAVVLFQAAAICSFMLLRGRAARSPIWRQPLVPDSYLRQARIGMAITTAYQFTAQYTTVIPSELASVFRAVFYGVGMLCVFILMQQWGGNQLKPGEKIFVAVNLAAQIVMHLATLYLIVGASILLLALISYTTASRKLPIPVLVAGVLVFGLLHMGKSRMRQIYWQPDSPGVGFSQLPSFFSQWLTFSLEARARTDEGITSKLLERTSLFHILCIAVDAIPQRQPHLDGETYAIIPAQFIPRLFWPDKPGPHKSNSRLAVYLGFVVDEEAAQKVSIAFGTPCEAYVNFGTIGVLLLGVFYGLLYKKFALLTAGCPPLSVGGVMMVLLLAWSLQAEQTLAVWISSFYQAAIVLVGAPVAVKVLFGR